MGSQTLTTADSSPWSTPAGAINLVVKCYGAGGGGGGSSVTKSDGAGAGGGGGGFAQKTYATPSGDYVFSVGTAGTAGAGGASPTAGGNGGQTYWVSAATCRAGGGGGGAVGVAGSNATAGLAGDATTGDVFYDGGAGYLGASGAAGVGGGGGGTGGTGSVGNSATSSTGATAVTGGYNGGNGGLAHTDGSSPTDAYGGGGGGGGHTNVANAARAGAAGTPGCIVLTWDVMTPIYKPVSGDDLSTTLLDTAKAFLGIVVLAASTNAATWNDTAEKYLPAPIKVEAYDTNSAAWNDTVGAHLVGRLLPHAYDNNSANLNDTAVQWQHGYLRQPAYDTNAAAWSDTADIKLKQRHWLDNVTQFLYGKLTAPAYDTNSATDTADKYLSIVGTTPVGVDAYDTNAGNLADQVAGYRRIGASAYDDNSANLQDEPEPYLGGKEIYAPAYSDNSANLIDGVSKRSRSRRWQDSVAISLEIDWTPEIYPIRLPIGDQVTIQDGPMDLDAEYLVGVEDTLEQSDWPKIHLPSAIVPLPAPAEDALEQSDDVQVGYIGKLFVRTYDNNDTLDDEVDRSLIGFLSVPASDENTSSDAAVGFYCMFASVSEDAPDWQAQPRIDFTGPGYLAIPASSGWPYYGTDRINLFLRIYASVGDSNQPDDYVKGFGVGLDLGGGDGSIPTLYSVQPAVPLTAGRPV